MTAPGIYNPDQLAECEAMFEHARRVARDEDDTEAREVEAMARAICWRANPDDAEGDGWVDWIEEAQSARNALLAMREGE